MLTVAAVVPFRGLPDVIFIESHTRIKITLKPLVRHDAHLDGIKLEGF